MSKRCHSECSNIQSASKVVNGPYQLLILKRASLPKRCTEKWLPQGEALGISAVNWKNTYQVPFLCTRATKLRVFQVTLQHRRVATNDLSFEIGLLIVHFVKKPQKPSLITSGIVDIQSLFWGDTFRRISQNFYGLKDFLLFLPLCLGIIDEISHADSPFTPYYEMSHLHLQVKNTRAEKRI